MGGLGAQGSGQGHDVVMELFALFGEVNAVLAPIPGVGLTKDQVFFLQGVDYPGDIGLVFEGLLADFALRKAIFLAEMADDAPLLGGDLIAVLLKAALQGGFQGQGCAVDNEAQGILDGDVVLVHGISCIQ